MPVHGGLHWSRTACLCACHWGSSECDDKDCKKFIASESKTDAAQAPVTAAAASPVRTFGFPTPLGYTSRFVG